MSGNTDIVDLGGVELVEGNPVWETSTPVGGTDDDREPLGPADAYQALGFASAPAPADDAGKAEGVVIRDCGGRPAVCIGGRDTRNADIVGKLGPGDTAMFATGPGAVAQVQCKASKRQVVLATKDSKGRSMVALLDGKNDKVQIAGLGAVIQIDDRGDIALTNAEGSGILIQGSKIHILGELAIPGMQPGQVLMMGPPTGTPNTMATPIPLFPVFGVGK